MPDQTTDVVTNGIPTITFGGTGESNNIASEDSNIQGNNGASSTPSTQNVQNVQPQEQKVNQREAFFQSRYDKLTGYLKNIGIELNPDMDDYTPLFQPYVESYRAINDLKENPHRILEAAKELFPDKIVEDSDDMEIQEMLRREFGEDFLPNNDDMLRIGTPSYKYFKRMNQITAQIEQRRIQQKWESEQQQQQQRQQMAEQFNTGVSEVAREFNIAPERVNEYVKALADPNLWSVRSLYILAQLAKGEIKLNLPQQTQQKNVFNMPPPSPGNIPGGMVPQSKGFIDGIF